MNKDGIFELALFPIPGCVSFPQTIVPLHVFEPRYRQMIQDCVAQNRLLGVCHTKSIERFALKQVAPVTNEKDLHQLYQQNLTTFSPEDIFSAGPVEITETTEDGRFLISIQMLKRFRLTEIVQNEPYKIGRCEEYLDDHELFFNHAEENIQLKRSAIIKFIATELQKLGPSVKNEILEIKAEKSINNFTFKLFKFFRMPEYQMQQILNSRDPLMRLDQLYEFTRKFDLLKRG